MQWTLLTKPLQAGEKAMRFPSVVIKHTQWGAYSLLPTVLLISNSDVAVGPPGTQGVIAMTLPMPVAHEASVAPCSWDLYQVSSSCFHFVMVLSAQLTSVLTPLPQSWKVAFYVSLVCTVIFPQNVFSAFCHCSSNHLVLWGALLGNVLTTHPRCGLVCFYSDLTLT